MPGLERFPHPNNHPKDRSGQSSPTIPKVVLKPVPYIVNDGAGGRIFDHHQEPKYEVVFVQIRKIAAHFGAVVIDRALVVVA